MTAKTELKDAAEAGRKGPDVRSDCWVKIAPAAGGGIEVRLNSKVESLYGDSIRQLVADELKSLGLPHARVELEDAGALPFVLMARIETAVRRLGGHVEVGYLPEFSDAAKYPTTRERFRRSRLYLPGNEPKFMLNAGLHKPDGVILDLEDSVPPAEKDAARIMVRNALRTLDFTGAERMVRINQGDMGLEDLEFVVPHNVHVVLIPKVETPDQVTAVDQRIQQIRDASARERASQTSILSFQSGVFLMPIIESAKGAILAYEIATASPNIVALTIGVEDYTADLGTERTNEGRETFWARCQVVNAARAAGVQPIDSVFADVSDVEALRASVREAKSLGFEGKGCIHPRQIPIIHEAFAPTPAELDKARKIVEAFNQAQSKGQGVVSLGSKMIDPPVVKRALRTVQLAETMK